MKGIIFNLLEEVVTRIYGEDTWDQLLTATALDGAYPGFFSSQPSTRPFVLSVNSIIHPEVRKVYPGADVPTFDFHDEVDGSLAMGYRSPRRLCALAQGFIEGAATHYGETVIFEHRECMHKGDKRCLCVISFPSSMSP